MTSRIKSYRKQSIPHYVQGITSFSKESTTNIKSYLTAPILQNTQPLNNCSVKDIMLLCRKEFFKKGEDFEFSEVRAGSKYANQVIDMKKYLWLAAAALLSAGIYFSEPRLVFGKAARICLECIGIG